ncbi:MAG: hypothetical protein JWP89_4411 [Schlesneria sp.]|nr:hypothetical protein [Schlesneria sp.]
MKAWQYIRRHFVRIVICAVLALASFWAVGVYANYQREQRIAKRIESLGGIAGFRYCGLDWLPLLTNEDRPFLDRIVWIDLTGSPDPPLSDVGSLTNLEDLLLKRAGGNDAGLKHLKGLTSLKVLSLNGTQITDGGLESIMGSKRLEELFLNDTQVTNGGLELLKCLTKLKVLSVINTQITDAGLQHLNGLTSLELLYLVDTQTTEAGRSSLRKSLPNCKIYPDP